MYIKSLRQLPSVSSWTGIFCLTGALRLDITCQSITLLHKCAMDSDRKESGINYYNKLLLFLPRNSISETLIRPR